MTILGIDLNDAGILIVDGQTESVSAPGYAVARDREILVGYDAWKLARLHPRRTTNRFWQDLSDQPVENLLGGEVSTADLAHAQLENLCAGFRDGLEGAVFVVPAHWSNEQFGLLLGIAEDLAIPVLGLVDFAVAATRCEYPGRTLLHLDASLHEVTISQMNQTGGSSIQDRRTIDQAGVDQLERACIELMARQFVETTRFDPLHDGQCEQYLYDNLYTWLDELKARDHVKMKIPFGGNEFEAAVNAADVAARIIDFVEPVVQNVRSLLSVGVPVAIQVTHRLATFPGFVEAMAGMAQVSVFVLEPGAAALGALNRVNRLSSVAGGVRLTGSLPWDRPAMAFDGSVTDSQTVASGAERRPTHVLYEGRAYRLSSEAFYIGSELAAGDYGATLDGRLSGISRKHCSIRVGDHGVEVVDHSRFGTRLNGHRVDGSAILQSGDVVSLGNPGSEFLLITEVTADSSSQVESDGAQKI
jgi:hypothetical protein